MEDIGKIPKTGLCIRIDRIVELCRGKRVLHIGMGGFIDDEEKSAVDMEHGALPESVHFRLHDVASYLVGTDINQKALDWMKDLKPGKYVRANLMDPGFAEQIGEKFEVVVFSEVLEHLDNMGLALNNIRQVLDEDGELILTTPNAFGLERFAKMLFRYEACHQAYEACHQEHTSYFSYMTIQRLLQMNGMKMSDFQYYMERPPRVRGTKRHMMFRVMKALCSVVPQYDEGVFVRAKVA